MRVRRYRPAYFTGFPDEEAAVTTLEELTAIPWVASWMTDEKFHRLSVSDHRLMVELDGGRHFYVVALFDGTSDFGLPQWSHP